MPNSGHITTTDLDAALERVRVMGEEHAAVINHHMGVKHLLKGLAIPCSLVFAILSLAFWQLSDQHNREIFYGKEKGEASQAQLQKLTDNHSDLKVSLTRVEGKVDGATEQLKVLNRRLDSKGMASTAPSPELPDGIHATIGKMPVKKQEYSVNGVPKDEECDPDK